MLLKRLLHTHLAAALWNLFLAYVALMVTRVAFVAVNWAAYAPGWSGAALRELLRGSLVFDTSALLYLNGLYLVLLLLPLPQLFIKRRKPATSETDAPVVQDKGQELMGRIIQLMEQEQVFRSKGLSVDDVAKQLGTNKTYISAFVNMHSGMSFSAFVNKYRVEFAQRLMKEHPDMRLSDVSLAAGFSSETSFFRNFKAFTGKSPAEWKESM